MLFIMLKSEYRKKQKNGKLTRHPVNLFSSVNQELSNALEKTSIYHE